MLSWTADAKACRSPILAWKHKILRRTGCTWWPRRLSSSRLCTALLQRRLRPRKSSRLAQARTYPRPSQNIDLRGNPCSSRPPSQSTFQPDIRPLWTCPELRQSFQRSPGCKPSNLPLSRKIRADTLCSSRPPSQSTFHGLVPQGAERRRPGGQESQGDPPRHRFVSRVADLAGLRATASAVGAARDCGTSAGGFGGALGGRAPASARGGGEVRRGARRGARRAIVVRFPTTVDGPARGAWGARSPAAANGLQTAEISARDPAGGHRGPAAGSRREDGLCRRGAGLGEFEAVSGAETTAAPRRRYLSIREGVGETRDTIRDAGRRVE